MGDRFGVNILNVGMVAKTPPLNSYMIPILQPAHDMDSAIRVIDSGCSVVGGHVQISNSHGREIFHRLHD